ncbi:MAG: DUF5675 family protein [Candidatus Pacearchaeota archaeon]|nr:DUF5675 family protein [Candidatus Pacearchaeota archaeon]MCX6750251.1 DUF5675 family protein [Candidatus Pacearchaeota archaeon]
MKLELKRAYIGKTYTIGHLYVDGEFLCDTLEDIPRDVKIMNETCIPTGDYKIILNESNRFKRVMPLLLQVPNFEGIRIHAGNSEADTSGCILVGKNTARGMLSESRATFDKLFSMMTKAEDGIEIIIT